MKTSVRNHLLITAALGLWCSSGQAADYPTTVSGFNPVGYWRFDETAASPALNLCTNAGSLGSSADGNVILDVIKGQTGKVGNCIRLNNPGWTVGYAGSKVDVPWSGPLNPNPPFTIEFWAKPN